MADDEYEIPNDDDVTADDIQPGADLSGTDLSNSTIFDADLSDADLSQANLSNAFILNTDLIDADFRTSNLSAAKLDTSDLTGANLRNTDLNGASLAGVELTGADLFHANLSDADLRLANLTDTDLGRGNLDDANLENADLTGSDLQRADLSGANIKGATLKNTDLDKATLKNLNVDVNTEFGNTVTTTPKEMIDDWDRMARTHHDLKINCNENGLINKARKQHYLERRARGYEQKDAIDLNPWFTATWLGSFLSRILIGYGVEVRRLLATMAVLFVGSTAVYLAYGVGGDAAIDTISYSVRAFTVAPPTAPGQFLPHVVMMIETFFGTLSIVLLGYVLSNREQF